MEYRQVKTGVRYGSDSLIHVEERQELCHGTTAPMGSGGTPSLRR